MKPLMTAITLALTLSIAAMTAVAADECCPADGQAPAPAQAKVAPVMADGQKMPEGHPPLDQMNQGALGTLVIKVVPKVDQAPSPAGAPVHVAFYQKGEVFHRLDTKLDGHGVVMIEDIAIQGVVQPVVTVTYDGVDYRKIAHPMASARPDQVLKMPVYPSTDEKPDWSIKMRHVIARPGPHGLEVTEMLLVNNPTQKAWVGAKGDDEAEPVTLTLPIPENAKFVQFGRGIDASKMQIEKDRVVSHLPLLPGSNELSVGYVVPVVDGAVTTPIGLPYAVKHMMLFASADAGKVTVEGMAEGKTMQAGQGEAMKVFQAADVQCGAKISISIEGMKQPAEAAPAQNNDDRSAQATGEGNGSSAPKLVAGVGGLGLLVTAVAFMIFRSPANAKKA